MWRAAAHSGGLLLPIRRGGIESGEDEDEDEGDVV